MSETGATPREMKAESTIHLRRRKLWWLLPVAVLFLLLAVIYLLEHMSSTDSEMYPTTEVRSVSVAPSC